MRVSASVVFAVCILAVIGALALGAGPAMGQAEDGSEVENTSQTIEIELEDDGDANVSVRKQFPLETPEDRQAFGQLADEFEDGEASGELSIDVFERIAADAENETDREMSITDVERSVETTNSTGTVELSFHWKGFANAEGGEIEVGDVFVIEGETWLPSLSADQRFTITAPENYAVDTVTPETSVSGGEFAWEGPMSFEAGELEVILIPSDRSSGGLSLLSIGLGLGLVVAIVALVYSLSRRSSDAPVVPTPADDRGWATVLTPTADRNEGPQVPPPSAVEENESEPEPETEPDPFTGVDEELLSDEERVLRLLEVNDGRMKQASIVTETDWSNAKVSQLLSAMEDEGEIEKLRIGRENLITLREE